jgi:hypothetical protein
MGRSIADTSSIRGSLQSLVGKWRARAARRASASQRTHASL